MRYIISLALASLPTLALAEVPKVVTDIPPVHALVSQVMGDLGTPVTEVGSPAVLDVQGTHDGGEAQAGSRLIAVCFRSSAVIFM